MIEEDFDALFDTDIFAQPVTFTPSNGPPQTINMIFDEPYLDLFNQVGSADFVLSAPVSYFATKPKKGDRFTMTDGRSFALITPASLDKAGLVYTLEMNIW